VAPICPGRFLLRKNNLGGWICAAAADNARGAGAI
jgi:hypothetical protein